MVICGSVSHFNQSVCFFELFANDILESSTENGVFFLLSSVVYGWVTIHAQPLFHLIALPGQKVQDSFDSTLLGKILVVHLEVFLFVLSLVFNFITGLRLPKSVLVDLLQLKLLLVAFDHDSYIPITHCERIVRPLWVLILKQICHLMQNSKADPVVRFDLFGALRNCFLQRLKVHSKLSSLHFDSCNYIIVTFSILLLSKHDCLEYIWLVLELILSLALLGCKLQKVEYRE